MKIINPSVELWTPADMVEHVCRCASVCYDSVPKTGYAARKFYEGLTKSGHLSVLRHESRYYFVTDTPDKECAELINCMMYEYSRNPYVQRQLIDGGMYVATNGQFLWEHPRLADMLKPFELTPEEMADTPDGKAMMRYTFCVVTQIGTSRELNRKSPNAITEQSTRYVREQGAICRPSWLPDMPIEKLPIDIFRRYERHKAAYEAAFQCYDDDIVEGVKPEEARGVLPLDTATKVVYTYSVREWRHIIDLRYHGTTGRPHPDAKIIAGMVREKLNEFGYDM